MRWVWADAVALFKAAAFEGAGPGGGGVGGSVSEGEGRAAGAEAFAFGGGGRWGCVCSVVCLDCVGCVGHGSSLFGALECRVEGLF